MNSRILQTTAAFLLPLLLLYSVLVLGRGHNVPGGGFTGGLIAAAALALYAVAYNVGLAKKLLRLDPHLLISGGLLLAAGSGLAATASKKPFLTGLWSTLSAGDRSDIHLGTPLLFDVGVYLVVFGVTVLIVLSLREEGGTP
jgi:multicomponent Na+:H+ antiporter subunit B